MTITSFVFQIVQDNEMIRLLDEGDYQLTETLGITKIIKLSGKGSFAWVNAGDIGEILVATSGTFKDLYTLATGKYRIYEVNDEPKLADTLHLELFTGRGHWQGYLLITGFPTNKHKRTRIIPTTEIITKSKQTGDPNETTIHPQDLPGSL